jgi:activator of HSP90 ATPase
MAGNIETYHWVEADLFPHCKKAAPELFAAAAAPADGFAAGDVTVEGEAYANTRKGKRILGYDLHIRVKCSVRREDGFVQAPLRAISPPPSPSFFVHFPHSLAV